MGDWLDGFTIVRGNSSGAWASDNEDAPKIVLHTTEGGTAEGAFGAFRTNNSWPHLTVDPVRRKRYQHVPLSEAARALRNTSAPGQTNRERRVFQIEIVGRAAEMRNMDDAAADWLGRDVLAPLAHATGCPLVTSVTFYDGTAGFTLASTTARQRLTPAKWDTYVGVLGHQHVPENTHWDPGAIPIHRILAAAQGSPITRTHPQGDIDMADAASLEQQLKVIKALADRLIASNTRIEAEQRAQKAKLDKIQTELDGS
jgi:hypothetical protein